MKRIISIVLILITGLLRAEVDTVNEEQEMSLLQSISSLHSPQADWTFSGMVTNENGERYDYFFQIQRNYTHFHAVATVVDGQDKSVLIYEDSSTLIEQPELTHWQVGNIFLRFNPISNSWIFGLKTKGKKGFNFKVDMLGLGDSSYARKQHIREGIGMLMSQTGRLNGHLQMDETSKEQFVTAKKAWFRQIWVSKPQLMKHPLTSVMCEFNDGSAFYSVTNPELDSLRGAVAGWRDADGASVPMSQFVTTQKDKDEGMWLIKISSPKMTVLFQNILNKINDNDQLIIGVASGVTPGFCTISRNEIEEHLT